MSKINLSKVHLSGYIKTLHGTHRILVTPDLAKKWLDLNTFNRPLSKDHVNSLAKRMNQGHWKLNGQCLIFFKNGNLGDGQHRLSAVISHGEPVWFDVAFGIDEDSFTTIDDGRKRSPKDALAIHDIPNYSNTASAIKKIIDIQRGSVARSRNAGLANVSNHDVLNWYYEHPEIADQIQLSTKWYSVSARIMSVSDFACYLHLMSLIDEKDAMHFLSKLALGSELSATNPIFKLRTKLMQARYDRQKKLTATVKRALVIKAWNYYRSNKSVKILKFDPVNEELPQIK